MSTIEKTLVKSPPELWELVDDRDLMGRWAAELGGAPGVVEVKVLEREPGDHLVWEASNGGPRIELALTEKGWGTNVTIDVTGADPDHDSTLDGLVDELGSPQRQPFTRT